MRTSIKLVRFLFVCAVLLAIAGGVFVGLTIWYFGRDLPDYQQLADYEPPITTRVHAGDGRLLAEYATERRVFVPIGAIPKRVIDAFLSAEDKNFYSHHGVDPISMLRAALTDLGRWRSKRRPVGASTITQQVAKNMLLSNEVSIERKIKEVLLATRIEEALSKDRILELYLNEIYLGSGAYGVVAAALTYFNKSLDELTLGEAAFLAGLPKAPNNYNPARFPQAAKARRDWVLDRMAEDGAATAGRDRRRPRPSRWSCATARRPRSSTAAYFAEEVRRELLARYGEKALYQGGLSVRTSLDARLQAAADKALRDGLIAYDRGSWRLARRRRPYRSRPATGRRGSQPSRCRPAPRRSAGSSRWCCAPRPTAPTIGLKDGETGRIPFAQMRWARPLRDDGTLGAAPRNAADVVKPGDLVLVEPLAETAKPAPTRRKAVAAKPAGPARPLYNLCQIPEVSGAVVAIDPHTGRVLAMSGGFSFEISQFNRATQAKRQPGSSIKPFVYLTALEHGFTPSTLVVDAPISISQGPGMPPWTPANYNSRRVPRADAAARRAREVAEHGDGAARRDRRHGGDRRRPSRNSASWTTCRALYAMALGAGETTPLRHTAAYAMLANGGKRITPTLIDRIQDRYGKTIFRADQRPCDGCTDDRRGRTSRCRRSPTPASRSPTRARPSRSSTMLRRRRAARHRHRGQGGRQADRRQDRHDQRLAGCLVCRLHARSRGRRLYRLRRPGLSRLATRPAAHLAAPIFRDFMMAALKDAPAKEFRTPPGLRMYRVSPAPGCRPGAGEPAIWEGYKPGTEPGKDRDRGLHGARAGAAGRRARRRRGGTGRVALGTSSRRRRRAAPAGLYLSIGLASETGLRRTSMRAETQAVVDDIKKSLALLRRHL